MAIAIRSETTGGVVTSGTDGTFAITKPSNVQDGDYLVVIIGKQDEPNVAPPAGWTIGSQGGSATGNDRWGGIYYRKITGSSGEPSSYTFDSEGTNEPIGWWIGSLSGIDSDTPQDVSFTGAGNWAALANDTSPNAPAVTVVTNGAMAFACWAVNTSSGTMPGGDWNTRASNVGQNRCFYAANQTFASSGTSTGAPEITLFSTGMETMVGMFVFRPMADRTSTLSKTLSSVLSSSDGKLADNANLSKTLSGVTFSSNGTVQSAVTFCTGTLTATLENLTETSQGTVAIISILSKVLDDVSFSSSGTVTTPPYDYIKAFGEQNPTQNETPVSWQTWSDGAGGTPTILGDSDWGKLKLVSGEEGRSAVYNIGTTGTYIFTLEENRYGSGTGTATLQIRGDTTSFSQDDVVPTWENYTVPISRYWNYTQVRLIIEG